MKISLVGDRIDMFSVIWEKRQTISYLVTQRTRTMMTTRFLVLVIISLIITYHINVTISCSKLEFHRIIGKRAEGDIKYDQNGTSIDQCLRLCRLMTDCYRVNYYGSDIGRCQIIVRYIGLTDMADWSYYGKLTIYKN